MGLIIMFVIFCAMLGPVFLVWWEVASTRRRRTRFRYGLATLFVLTLYVALVAAVVQRQQLRGEDAFLAALSVAGVLAVVRLLWLAVADVVHPKRRAHPCELTTLPKETPTNWLPTAVEPVGPVGEETQEHGPAKRRRRKHWWAKGLKRENYGHYGLWKAGGGAPPQ